MWPATAPWQQAGEKKMISILAGNGEDTQIILKDN
jgi:hypothetical protein